MENKLNRISAIYQLLKVAVIVLTIVLVSSTTATCKNYYFSTSIGNDSRTSTQAQNQSTPWKTITKLNAFFSSLLPGDSVLFKRGEVFYGSIRVGKSGISGSPIVVGAFGNGANPVITGFQNVSGWTASGGGIYTSSVTTCKSTLNMVTVNNNNTPIGRYPNTGYLTFESLTGNTSITDNQLTATPNWTGAEVVIRKSRYNIGRNSITNHNASRITYSGGGEIPLVNYGYFIQNSPKTLDLQGEWYLDPVSKKIQMFFGTANPALFTVKASTLDTLLYSYGKSFVSFINLDFEGANAGSICVNGGQNIFVSYCGIYFSGGYGVYMSGSPYFKIENSKLYNCNHKAVQVSASNTSIRYNKILNSGVIPGMAQESGGYNGIDLGAKCDNAVLEYNELDGIGKHGIVIRGNNVLTKNNLVNHFAGLLDDVGGIYTGGSVFKGRKIIGNIVLNGIGNISGTAQTTPSIKGIFMEASSSFIDIIGNTVSNCSIGFHFNNSHDLTIHNNLSYNNNYQFLSQNFAVDPVDFTRNLSIFNNIFFAKTSTQWTLRMHSKYSDVALFGKADSNYYCRPIDDNNVIYTLEGSKYTLHTRASWQTFTGQDKHSKKSPQTITNENDLLFEYNASTSNKTIPLPASYIDARGNVYAGSITLLPYTSTVLIRNSSLFNQSPKILNQSFPINENSVNGTNAGVVVATDPDAGQTRTFSIVSGNTSGAFNINALTGVITVVNSTALNFEITPSFALVVKVQDNGAPSLSSQATITINLLNVNENPSINNQTFNTIANSANGTVVGSVVASDPDAAQTLTYSILSGNINNAFSINATTGVLTVKTSSSLKYQTSPSFLLVVKVMDNGTINLSSQATITVNLIDNNICSATGNISYQVWNNISGSLVSDLTSNSKYPINPTSSVQITSMEAPSNVADSYGARIAGYICAPATGSYIFWIASDNNGELWLSTNDQPSNLQKIAYHTGATAKREWNKYVTQKSVAINLVQGQKYYIEALMKEAGGGDNLSVGWLKPGQTGTVPSEVIPGSVLSPLISQQTVLVTSVILPTTAIVASGSIVPFSSTVLPVNATNNSIIWTSSNTAIVTVDNNGLVTGIVDGNATITAKSVDGSNKSGSCLVTVSSPACNASGTISFQIWNNISGSLVTDLTSDSNYPDIPTSSVQISSMEASSNVADNYGARIAGYICAPATGSYVFWIASDNNGELWLSTDDQPANLQKIAYHTGATGVRAWNEYATQKSVGINLVRGQKYYIEALMKEAWGGDNLSVGWLKPGQTGTVPSEVIPGTVLSPLGATKSKQATIDNSLPSESEIKLSVYPNPLNSETLNISIENVSTQSTLQIYSASGVLCYHELISNGETIHIDRSLLKSGLYVIKVFNNDIIKTSKLVVK